jgi:hypothetical protein
MNSQPERVAKGTADALEPVGPSLIVKIVMRPMTKMLTTPVSAKRTDDTVVIALTFGNQSDWSRNARSAGGGTIRIEGKDYNVTQPQIMSRQEAKPLVEAAFSSTDRAGLRMLGIKQVMTLQVVSAEHLPGAAAATNAG